MEVITNHYSVLVDKTRQETFEQSAPAGTCSIEPLSGHLLPGSAPHKGLRKIKLVESSLMVTK